MMEGVCFNLILKQIKYQHISDNFPSRVLTNDKKTRKFIMLFRPVRVRLRRKGVINKTIRKKAQSS